MTSYLSKSNYFIRSLCLALTSRELQIRARLSSCYLSFASTSRPCFLNLRWLATMAVFGASDWLDFADRQRTGRVLACLCRAVRSFAVQANVDCKRAHCSGVPVVTACGGS